MSGIVRNIASIGVYAAGNAIGGPIGGAIASTIFGVLFPSSTGGFDGTRLEDLGREGADFGAPVKVVFGRMPVKADIIDCGLDNQGQPAILREEKTTKKKGGIFGIGGQKVTTYKYKLNRVAYLIAEGEYDLARCKIEDGDGEKVLFDRDASGDARGINFTPQIANEVTVALLSANIKFYCGTEMQEPDAWLVGIHGASKTPAYRGQCYAVVDGLEVQGQASFTWELESVITGKRVIIRQRMAQSGAPLERVRLNSISGNVAGCAIAQVEAARELIEKIASTEFHDLMWLDGGFVDVSRLNPATWVLESGDLGAYVMADGGGGEAPPAVNWQLQSVRNLATSLTLNFLDVDDDYQPNQATSLREVAGHENAQSIDYPFAASLPDMLRLADVMMDELWAAQTGETIALQGRHNAIAPGNVLVYDAGDGLGARAVRVTKQPDNGARGLVGCEGVIYQPNVYGIFRDFEVPVKDRPGVAVYLAPNSALLNLPPLGPSLIDAPALVGATATVAGASWRGATLESARLGDNDFETQASMGTLINAYTAPNALRFDDSGTIRVALNVNSLATTSANEAAQRANLLAVMGANEWGLVSFTTATPVIGAPGQFDLGGILSGRLGTEAQLSFAAGARVVVLSDAGGRFDAALESLPVALADLNGAVEFEVHASAAPEKSSGPQTIIPTGRNVRPLAPTVLQSETEGGTFTLRMVPRTRDFESADNAWLTGRTPRETDPRRFTFALFDGANAEIARQTIAFEANDALPLVRAFAGTSAVRGEVWCEGALMAGDVTSFEVNNVPN